MKESEEGAKGNKEGRIGVGPVEIAEKQPKLSIRLSIGAASLESVTILTQSQASCKEQSGAT